MSAAASRRNTEWRLLRARTRAAVDALAIAMDCEQVQPTAIELEALAVVCEARDLPAEAARIRRWMGES